jgi:hypothetical protein
MPGQSLSGNTWGIITAAQSRLGATHVMSKASWVTSWSLAAISQMTTEPRAEDNATTCKVGRMTLPAYHPAHADWTHDGRLRGAHPLVALGAALRGVDDSSGPCRLDCGIFTSGQWHTSDPTPAGTSPGRPRRASRQIRAHVSDDWSSRRRDKKNGAGRGGP